MSSAGTGPLEAGEDNGPDSRGELPGQYSCPRCGNDYRWKRNLTRHLAKECGKEPAFQCHSCDYRSKHKQHMLRHIASKHPKQSDNGDPLSLS